jgi:serine/threonine protein kinase
MPLSEGAQFAGYTIVRLLGSGEMGEVYLARHPRLPRFEALKILRADLSADPDFKRRFNQEADQASGLWHPHIVGVHDRGEYDGRLWIAMDYVNGPNLAAVLAERRQGGLATKEVVEVVSAVASALDHAHHLGLLHRDVKPENIMISRPNDGSTPRILLSDFGIARPTADDADATQAVTDTTTTKITSHSLNYSAPEQLRGAPIDGRTDQYALAATAYQLLTGERPFSHASPIAVINAQLTAAPPRPGATRPELSGTDVAFARALAKDPVQRFGRCGEFAAALGAALQHKPAAAPPPPPQPGAPPQAHRGPVAPPSGYPGSPPPQWQSAPPKRRRKSVVIGLVSALIAVAVLAAAGVFAVHKFSGPDPAQLAAQDRDAARLAGQHYLEALATGDARTVLSLSAKQPATPQLLTDKTLNAQLSATPLTNISVTNDASQNPDAPSDTQHLTLSARFGPTPSQTAISAQKKDGQWKLDTTTIAVTITPPPNADAAIKALTVSGASVNGATTISVFPGTPQVSSANRYIDISADTTPLLLEALTNTAHPPTITPVIALNDVGRQASLDALDRRLLYCFAGVQPPEGCCPPGGCPITQNTGVDPDSQKLVKLQSTQNMNYQLDPKTLRVHITGTLNYTAEGRMNSQTVPLRSTYTVDSQINLAAEPPVYVPRGQ